ncbi:hypothetical protein KQ871_15515, partial [Listeria monocytogenes]|nr:hypothetical protein [Listeria monocytogenes]
PIAVWLLSSHGLKPRFYSLVNISATFQALALTLVSYLCIRKAKARNANEDVLVAAIFSVAAAFCIGLVNDASLVPNTDYLD